MKKSTSISANSIATLAIINVPLLILTIVAVSYQVYADRALWGALPVHPQEYSEIFNIFALIPALIYLAGYILNMRRKHIAPGLPIFNWGVLGLVVYAVAFVIYIWLAGSISAINIATWLLPIGVLAAIMVYHTRKYRSFFSA